MRKERKKERLQTKETMKRARRRMGRIRGKGLMVVVSRRLVIQYCHRHPPQYYCTLFPWRTASASRRPPCFLRAALPAISCADKGTSPRDRDCQHYCKPVSYALPAYANRTLRRFATVSLSDGSHPPSTHRRYHAIGSNIIASPRDTLLVLLYARPSPFQVPLQGGWQQLFGA